MHAILRNPYRADGGSHHAGNKMALDNVRERLALHFDAEASLESRVTSDAYEVHIRMPYRTEPPRSRTAAARAAPRAARRRRRRANAAPARRDAEAPVADAPLRVLIVDDEAPARRRLRDLLDDCAAALPLAVVGEARQRPRGARPAAGGDRRPRAHRHPHAGHGRHRARAPPAQAAAAAGRRSSPPRSTSTRCRRSRSTPIDYLVKPVRVQRLLAALQKVPRLKPLSRRAARRSCRRRRAASCR